MGGPGTNLSAVLASSAKFALRVLCWGGWGGKVGWEVGGRARLQVGVRIPISCASRFTKRQGKVLGLLGKQSFGGGSRRTWVISGLGPVA